MSSTTSLAATERPLFAGESTEVLGLDEAAALAMVVEQRRRQDEAVALDLKVVTHLDPEGSLTWTSPLGRPYTVDEHGTLARS